MSSDEFRKIEITHATGLWDWLKSYHSNGSTVWLVTWKAQHRDKYVSRDEVLDALLAYGWIDGRRMKLDEDRTMQLISPRKAQAWTKTYRERADRLIKDNLMQAAGLARITEAKTKGLYDVGHDIDALIAPDDLLKALSNAGAKEWWDASAPSYQRNILRWLSIAKREDTRISRIKKIVNFSAQGEKVPNY